MILSNIRIHEALDQKRLVLDPEPAPRTKVDSGAECPYQTSAVDLRLGHSDTVKQAGVDGDPINVNTRLPYRNTGTGCSRDFGRGLTRALRGDLAGASRDQAGCSDVSHGRQRAHS